MAGAAVGTSLRHRGIPLDPGRLQALRILCPQLLLLRTQKIQVIPREDSGVVPIGKTRLDGVIANRVERFKLHRPLAHNCTCCEPRK